MVSEKSGLAEKFLNIDRRIIYIICLLCVSIPLVSPWGLPIGIDEHSRMFYNEVENLPPGSVVLLMCSVSPDAWGVFGPSAIDVIQHLFDKEDIKVIEVEFNTPMSAVFFDTDILTKIDQSNVMYGVDWVNLGFIEGKEIAMANVAQDMSYGMKDYYGNLLEDLPLMNEVISANDIDLQIYIGTGVAELVIRQIAVPYNLRAVTTATGMDVARYVTYMQAGIIQGILVESVGAAQYEYLLGKPGYALAFVDAISMLHIFMFTLAIAVNIVYLSRRMKGVER